MLKNDALNTKISPNLIDTHDKISLPQQGKDSPLQNGENPLQHCELSLGQHDKISIRQICFFIIAFLPITKFFTLPSLLAEISSNDMWLSGLINNAIDFVSILVVIVYYKNEKEDYFSLIEKRFGKIVAKIVLCIYFVFFIVKGAMPIIEQKDYIEYSLYTNRQETLYYLPFFVLCFYLATKKLNAIGRLSDIMWAVCLMGTFLLATLSLSNTDFGAILPIAKNENIIKGAIYSSSWFSDGAYFLFFVGNIYKKNENNNTLLNNDHSPLFNTNGATQQPLCHTEVATQPSVSSNKNKYKKTAGIPHIVISLIIYTFIVTLFNVMFYGIFSYISFRQRFALTETSKYTTVINNMGRFDYIAIAFILIVNLIATILPVFFATMCLNKLFEGSNKKKMEKNSTKKETIRHYIFPLITTLIELIITIVLSEYSLLIRKIICEILPPFIIFFGSVVPIISPLIIRKNSNEKNSTNKGTNGGKINVKKFPLKGENIKYNGRF